MLESEVIENIYSKREKHYITNGIKVGALKSSIYHM